MKMNEVSDTDRPKEQLTKPLPYQAHRIKGTNTVTTPERVPFSIEEIQKVEHDLITYGSGCLCDGIHVPFHEVSHPSNPPDTPSTPQAPPK